MLLIGTPLLIGIVLGIFVLMNKGLQAPVPGTTSPTSTSTSLEVPESATSTSTTAPTTPTTGSASAIAFLHLQTPAAIALFDAREAASSITASGATKGNAGSDANYNLEGQRLAYIVIVGGVAGNDSALIDTGLRALEWGFARQAANGSFSGERATDSKVKYQNIHPVSFFVEAAAHSVLLIRSSNVAAAYKTRAEALVPKIQRAAVAMNDQANLNDFFSNSVDTNQLTTVAAGLQEAGVLSSDSSLTSSAKALVDKILARQTADGTFSEKKGFDASYQTVSLDYLLRYASYSTERNLEWKSIVMKSVQKGWDKERSVIHGDGTIDTSKNTRTQACGAPLAGNGPKGRDIDVIPLRLYEFGFASGQLATYGALADAVEKVGQGFDHIGTCKGDSESII